MYLVFSQWISEYNRISSQISSLSTSNILWSWSPPNQLMARLTILKFFIMKLISVISSLSRLEKTLDWAEWELAVSEQGTWHWTGHRAEQELLTSHCQQHWVLSPLTARQENRSQQSPISSLSPVPRLSASRPPKLWTISSWLSPSRNTLTMLLHSLGTCWISVKVWLDL